MILNNSYHIQNICSVSKGMYCIFIISNPCDGGSTNFPILLKKKLKLRV